MVPKSTNYAGDFTMLFLYYSQPFFHKGKGMKKLITASALLFIISMLQTNAFAASLKCKFKDVGVVGVKTVQVTDENLIINSELEIPLEKSRVSCGNFGRQTRLDGAALGYQVVLKTCTSDAKMEGHLIDSVNEVAAEMLCDQM